MTFDLDVQQLQTFFPLPGHALIRTLPAPLKTDSNLLHIPEAAAESQQERAAVRKGELVRISVWRDNSEIDKEFLRLRDSKAVYYYGKEDEADNRYVVVKIQQIVAVELLW